LEKQSPNRFSEFECPKSATVNHPTPFLYEWNQQVKQLRNTPKQIVKAVYILSLQLVKVSQL
jgi:hypothetical protein